MPRTPATPPPPVERREVVKFDAKQAYADIEQAIRDREDAIVATLAPSISKDRFISVALQAITRSPRLLECTPVSIVKALRDAAELGLEPSGLLGSAYLVPYKNRQTQRYEAQLIPGYRGLIDLARRSGEVKTVEARVVRERDDFDFAYGSDQFLRHHPWMNLRGDTEKIENVDDNTGEVTTLTRLLDAGPYVAFYALARLTSGEVQFDVMSKAEVDAIRKRSKAADDGPWVTDYVEMGRKTPTRRLLKWLPLNIGALQRALELEDIAESTAVSPSSVTVTAPNRARLQAALGVNGGATSTDDVSEDTREEATVDPDASLDASDDTDGEPSTCPALDPFEHSRCTKPDGHDGAHSNDTGTWPA